MSSDGYGVAPIRAGREPRLPVRPTRSAARVSAALISALAVLGLASAAGGPARAAVTSTSAAPQSSVRWAGSSFRRAEGLRRHLGLRGGRWDAFLRAHPRVTREFGLEKVVWQRRAFYSRAGISAVLRANGVSYLRWQRVHPGAAAKLRRNRTAAVPTAAAAAPAPRRTDAAATGAAASPPPPVSSSPGAAPALAAPTARNPAARRLRFGVSLDNPEYRASNERDREFDELAEMGAGWVRFDVKWADVQWDGPDSFNWSKYDPLVDAARARGLQVLANLAYSPSWARDPGTDDKFAPQTPERREAFARFAAEAARHFAGRIEHWELWNEPNSPIFWRPSPNAVDYAALINVAYRSVKAARPGATVLAGATAPAQNGDGWIDEVDFLNAVYAAGGRGSFDAWSHHPYEFIWGPGLVHAQSAWYQMFGTSPSLRSAMVANGDESKQIWGTESGPPSQGSLNGFTFSEEHQARQITQTHEAWLTYPWAGVLFAYTGRDLAAYGGGDSWSYLGLLRHDLSRKPAWFSFRASALAG